MTGFLNPNEVLNQLEIKEGMVAADFGSGSGGWAIPLAKRLKNGKVYALDVQEEMLSALRGKAEIENIFNIETKKADVGENTGLKPDSLDLVLLTNLLFQNENKEKIILEAGRTLKPGGQILVVDWLEGSPLGPTGGRVSAEEVKKIAQGGRLKNPKRISGQYFPLGLDFL